MSTTPDLILFNEKLSSYGLADSDQADGSTRYTGYVKPDGGYYILKETTTGTVTSYRYSKGSSGYATAWGNRASETYAAFNAVFK